MLVTLRDQRVEVLNIFIDPFHKEVLLFPQTWRQPPSHDHVTITLCFLLCFISGTGNFQYLW